VTYDQAHDWKVDDPRLEALADAMAERFGKQLAEAGDQADELRMEKVLSAGEQKLFAEYVNDYSPAWVRLNEMVAKRITR